jgi:hypothetical protein
MKSSILFLSDVLSSLGRERVGALVARLGAPQSSNVWSRPGIRETREY